MSWVYSVATSIARKMSESVLLASVSGRVKLRAVTTSAGRFRPKSTTLCSLCILVIITKTSNDSTAGRGAASPRRDVD